MQIMTNFGSSKMELTQKYRLGLEHALTKADFLNAPDMTLVQAFTVFLCLVRRHDGPKFVWMMTGLVIRMAQYLGLQRDGMHFKQLTPFEVEMRRRVWWAVCMLDARTSEDQGTDLTIATNSFDTKVPLNINDADISFDSKEAPVERTGLTDMSFARVSIGWCNIARQMMGLSIGNGPAGIEAQNRLLDEFYQTCERDYLQYATASGNIAYWVAVTIARLVKSKMTLIVYLPVLFSSPSVQFSDEIRTKLLVSAIEVAEYNHALNSEQACRQWRWIYQTYTHWHAIVFIMIEIARRPWSSTVERAWVVLHSPWLIPAQKAAEKSSRMWFPLRKLIARDRQHRNSELIRLRNDPHEANRLDTENDRHHFSSNCGPFSTGSSVDAYRVFRERWRKLVGIAQGSTEATTTFGTGFTQGLAHGNQSNAWSSYSQDPDGFDSSSPSRDHPTQTQSHYNPNEFLTGDVRTAIADMAAVGSVYSPPMDLTKGQDMGSGLIPWLYTDTDSFMDILPDSNLESVDMSVDMEDDMNWASWVESAKGFEWEAGLAIN